MERIQAKDLKVDTLVTLQNFMVSDIKIGTTKAGKEFASFKVSDKTGSMPAVWWDYGIHNKPIQTILAAGVIQVGGSVSSYNNSLQLKVESIAPSDGYDAKDFEKVSKYDPEIMWAALEGYIENFQSDFVKRVAKYLMAEYGERFKVCAAATGMHHAFKYGLLEHTTQMLKTGEVLLELPFYKEVLCKDMVMFGLMFHDFGKIFEYGPPPDFKKTVEGAKRPHIPATSDEITVACRMLEVPREIELELTSICLSHHRQIAWGSPVSFSSADAAFVHYIDNLHGDVFGITQRVENDTSSDLMVKHGFGSDAFNIVKKTPGMVLEEHSKGDLNDSIGF